MNISEKILYMRKLAGLNQEELAEIVGVSRQAVSKWETGDATPEVGKLLLLSRAFGVTADWLISEEGLPPQKREPQAAAAGPEPETFEDEAQCCDADYEPARAADPEPEPRVTWWEALVWSARRHLRRLGWRLGLYAAIAGALLMIVSVLGAALLEASVERAFGGRGAVTFINTDSPDVMHAPYDYERAPDVNGEHIIDGETAALPGDDITLYSETATLPTVEVHNWVLSFLMGLGFVLTVGGGVYALRHRRRT